MEDERKIGDFTCKRQGLSCQRCHGDILLGEAMDWDRKHPGNYYHRRCWQQVKAEDPERGRRGGDRTPPPPEATPERRGTENATEDLGADKGAEDDQGAEVEARTEQDGEGRGDEDQDDGPPDGGDLGDSEDDTEPEDEDDGRGPGDMDGPEADQDERDGDEDKDSPPPPFPQPRSEEDFPPMDPLTALIWEQIKARVHGLADNLDAVRWAAAQEQVQRIVRDVTREVQQKTQQVLTIPGVVENKPLPDLRHPNWERCMALAALRIPQYWWGDSQCGKSHTAYQIAEFLDRPLIPIALGPSMQHTHLLGYRQADGTYSATAFFLAWTTKCVGLFDEYDNAAAPLLTLLNGGWSQGAIFFPEPIGLVRQHPESVIIATGNTNGNGGNEYYGERRIFEASTKQRLAYTYWTYDKRIEDAMVHQFLAPEDARSGALLSWGRLVRAATKGAQIPILCTPTALRNMARVAQQGIISAEDAAEMFVWKGADEDVKRQLRVPLYPGGPRDW